MFPGSGWSLRWYTLSSNPSLATKSLKSDCRRLRAGSITNRNMQAARRAKRHPCNPLRISLPMRRSESSMTWSSATRTDHRHRRCLTNDRGLNHLSRICRQIANLIHSNSRCQRSLQAARQCVLVMTLSWATHVLTHDPRPLSTTSHIQAPRQTSSCTPEAHQRSRKTCGKTTTHISYSLLRQMSFSQS